MTREGTWTFRNEAITEMANICVSEIDYYLLIISLKFTQHCKQKSKVSENDKVFSVCAEDNLKQGENRDLNSDEVSTTHLKW